MPGNIKPSQQEESKKPWEVFEDRVRSAFSGVNVLYSQLSGQVTTVQNGHTELRQQVDKYEADLAMLKERVSKLEGHKEGAREAREDTSRHYAAVLDVHKDVRGAVVEEKKIETEKWKATAPLIIAVITGAFGTITGIIAILRAFLGNGD